MTEWISVAERLPDKGRRVLVFLRPSYIEFSTREPEADESDDTHRWLDETGEKFDDIPTHWMPIPEPPK